MTSSTIAHMVVLCLAVAGVARAQGGRPLVTVRVHVADSAHVAIADADVSLLRASSEMIATGVSDGSGIRLFRAERGDSAFDVVVRKVGYAPTAQTIRLAGRNVRDTVSVEITLRHSVQQLSGVQVHADASVRRLRTFVDADAIAASDRPLIDGVDVIFELRPDMVYGIGGKRPKCPPLANVWVNNEWIRGVPENAVMASKSRDAKRVAKLLETPATKGVMFPPSIPLNDVSLDVLSILASIKPEHIDSIVHHDCGDLSDPRTHTSSAVFITLKPGVQFEPGLGSFVPGNVAGYTSRTTAAAVTQALPADQRYRARLLGIFDEGNGNPIAAADVTEVATGTKARTSYTGTVSLGFMRDGGGVIAVSKPGYAPDTITVVISPADTTPVTVLLHKM